MASNSIVSLTGDGTTTEFNFSFTGGYLAEADVLVRVGDEVDGAGQPVHRSRTFLNAGRIKIGGAVPANGEKIVIYRQTPVKTSVNDFSNGDILDAGSLDKGFDQLVKVAQELKDASGSALGAGQEAAIAKAEAEKAKASADKATAAAEANVTVAEASELTALTTPTKTAIVQKVQQGYRGGGLYIHDADSTKAADDIRVFAPAFGGRFIRPIGTGFLASELGLRSAASLDQHAAFQKAVVICANENQPLLFDMQTVSCNGGDIWVNEQGTAQGVSEAAGFTMRATHRRVMKLTDVYMTFGKMHSEVDGVMKYGVNRGASSSFRVEDMHFEGAIRFLNIEGTLIATGNTFEPETGNASFGTSLPSTWGANPFDVDSIVGAKVTKELYTSQVANAEFLFCNHALLMGNNFQFGKNFTNGAGNNLEGVSFAQCSNPTILSGRAVHSERGIRVGAHPIYGGSGSANVNINGLHLEENIKEGALITHAKNVHINLQGRPHDTAMTHPLIRVENPSNAIENVRITGDFNGPLASGSNDVCVQLDGGKNVSVDIRADGFTHPIKVAEGVELAYVSCQGNNTKGCVYDPGVIQWLPADGFASYSPTARARSVIGIEEDFASTAHSLTEAKAPSVTTEVNPYGLLATIPSGAAKDLSGGIKVASGKRFQANQLPGPDFGQGIEASGTVGANSSNCGWFIGLTGNVVSTTMPCVVTAAGVVTPDAAELDFAGFIYRRYANGATIHCVSRNNGGVIQVHDTTDRFLSTTPMHEYKVEVRKNGSAKFTMAGVEVAQFANAVRTTEPLGVALGAHTMSGGGNVMNLGYLSAKADRKMT